MRSRSSTLLVLALVLPSAALVGCGGASEGAAYPSSRGHSKSNDAPQSFGYPASQAASDDVAATGDRSREEASAKTPPPPPLEPAPASPHTRAPAPGSDAQANAVAQAGRTTRDATPNRELVIYTARLTMAVYQVDQGLSAVERIARENDGYLGLKQDREITVRVPRGRFDVALAALDKIGDVLHRDIRAEDVTDEHVDLEIRIRNARAMQQRLAELLTKASVKEALEIEKELHRVTEELERLEGRMKVLRDKIAFSTITVAFQPRGVAIETARVRLPFPWLGGLNLPSLLSLSEEK